MSEMTTLSESLDLALQHHQAGRLPEAEALYRQILEAQPDNPHALHLLGVIAHQVGQHDAAIQLITRAIALNPAVAEYHNNLGEAYRALGKPEEAEAQYRLALARKPAYAEAHNNLGAALQEQGRLDEAMVQYREALARNPAHAEAHSNLGAALQAQGKFVEAVAQYRQALVVKPSCVEAFNNLGNLLKDQGRLDEAMECYQQALALRPGSSEIYSNLGVAFMQQGRPDEAAAHFRQALAIRPQDGLKIKLATLLPVIVMSPEDIPLIRHTLESYIDALMRENPTVSDPVKEVSQTTFYLAYHGYNVRELQMKVAQLYERACPSLLYTAPHCAATRRVARTGKTGKMGKKVKVGFVSKHLCNHSIGRTFRGVLAQLPRRKFCVYAVFAPPVADDEIATFIRQKADKTVVLSGNLKVDRERLAAEEMDILCYLDVGMEAYTYFLAFSRLAPVQCVTFGHPVTTGIRNMDYFISTEDFEPEGAEAHYSERLIRMKAPIAYYYKPDCPPLPKSKRDFGFGEDEHLYICPQTLFKFHPEFDAILSGILDADPRARIVLKRSNEQHWATLLLQRFSRTMPQALNRVTMLPPQSLADYLNLIAVSEVMLDTIHFGGFNTSLDAFSVGTPVVTLPGEFQRSRHTLAFYGQMGFRDCVADSPSDYVRIAVRLGTDAPYRKKIKTKILATCNRLFEDRHVIKEYERVFLEMIERA